MSWVIERGCEMKKIVMVLLIALVCQPVSTSIGVNDDTSELTIYGCRAITGFCDMVGEGFSAD